MLTPCVKVCKIENDLCLGCGRTLLEIAKWRSYSDLQRLEIIASNRVEEAGNRLALEARRLGSSPSTLTLNNRSTSIN